MNGHRPNLQLNSYFGPYFLEKLIAVGGMAEIYLARTQGVAGFEKQLVLKVMQPELATNSQFVQMLVGEAKVAVGLNHPNIAQTFDLGKIGNAYFITMEYVDGADFFQILKAMTEMNADCPIDAALYVVHEALCGLDYAHNKCDDQGKPLKIIHRDISPQNILLSRNGEVKIVDFGIAKAANLSHKTRAGVIKGKLVYMSPEQAWGEPIDHRADIFSAGIVLYEALTMGSLYMEKNPARLLERVRRAQIDPPSGRRSEIPPELDQLVMKALHPDRTKRYQNALEFADAIRAYQVARKHDFHELHLGAMVEAVLAGERPERRNHSREGSSPNSDSMDREDFAVQAHSVIFSAQDLMDATSVPPPGAVSGAAAGDEPAPGVGTLKLLDDLDGRIYELGQEFIIGRAGDLRLGDARVSRRHASITMAGNSYVLTDLGSSNGTYLNDQKIDGKKPLKPGDVIRVGPFSMEFAWEPAPAAAPERSERPAPARKMHPTEGVPPVEEERRSEADQPRPAAVADGATVVLTMGAEQLTLDVGERLPLSHTIVVGDSEIEGEAAALVRRPDGYWMEPAPGGEGIFHNGRRISAPAPLRSGDTVGIGPLQLQFRLRS